MSREPIISEVQETWHDGYVGLNIETRDGGNVFVFHDDGRQRQHAKGADFDLAHYIRDALEWRGRNGGFEVTRPAQMLVPREEDLGIEFPGVAFTMPSGGTAFVTRWNGAGRAPDAATVLDWADARELVAGLDRLHYKPVQTDHLTTTLRDVLGQFRAALATDMPGDLANARALIDKAADGIDSALYMLNRLNESLTEKLSRPEAFGLSPPRHTCGVCHADITVDVQGIVRAAVQNATAQAVPDAGEGGDRAASNATGGQTPVIPHPERVDAPWSEEFVNHLNKCQSDNTRHPYTCGSGNRTDEHHLDGEGKLIATRWGWLCPFCDYRQSWAHGSGKAPASGHAAATPPRSSIGGTITSATPKSEVLESWWTIQFEMDGKWHSLDGWRRFCSTDEAAMRDFRRLVEGRQHGRLRLVGEVTTVRADSIHGTTGTNVPPCPVPAETTETEGGHLGQSDVVEMVLEERRYQDARWGSIHERAHEVGGWLTLLRHHIGKASADWSESSGDVLAVHGVRKIAAIAVACLEQHATPEHYRNHVEAAKEARNDADSIQEGR